MKLELEDADINKLADMVAAKLKPVTKNPYIPHYQWGLYDYWVGEKGDKRPAFKPDNCEWFDSSNGEWRLDRSKDPAQWATDCVHRWPKAKPVAKIEYDYSQYEYWKAETSYPYPLSMPVSCEYFDTDTGLWQTESIWPQSWGKARVRRWPKTVAKPGPDFEYAKYEYWKGGDHDRPAVRPQGCEWYKPEYGCWYPEQVTDTRVWLRQFMRRWPKPAVVYGHRKVTVKGQITTYDLYIPDGWEQVKEGPAKLTDKHARLTKVPGYRPVLGFWAIDKDTLDSMPKCQDYLCCIRKVNPGASDKFLVELEAE